MARMDPADPSSFNHVTALLSTGRTYHFVDEKPANYDARAHPAVLCVHGFPDSWYGWRHQVAPWVARGLRVVVPDMLGYGGTDKPRAVAEYTTRRLCADLAALLDHLALDTVVLAGHDWGSYTAGRFALWHTERLRALIL
jgi:soluble epoxide hydrolase/lipid-phosphate phosphatase